MIGRMELTEILGMAGTCAVLLFAGFVVETLEVNVASGAEVEITEVPAADAFPEGIRLELPTLEVPAPPIPPPVAAPSVNEYATCGSLCRCVRIAK
jgi:hypothetical protein